MHVAELNIGRLKHPIDDPRMADFVDNLERVNAMADRMRGFVWRLIGDGSNGGALDLRPFPDPMMAVNMSVWETVEQLGHFVWNTVHKRIYQKKGNWFTPMTTPHFVMWWVPVGHEPTPPEALARLEHLATHGPSDHAFGWESLPNIKLWMGQRCA
jgi:hypothetical protein